MREIQVAVESISSKLASNSNLSMKTTKQLVRKSLGIQRLNQSKLLLVLNLGLEQELFMTQENCVVAYKKEASPSREHLMSREAKDYYDKAIKTHRIYANQLEMYLDYCEERRATGEEPAHPKVWVIGDIE